MRPEDILLAEVARGRALLDRERALILAGRFDEIGLIAEEKLALLASLEVVMPRSSGTPPVREALDALISDSRHNERLIDAARRGLKSARRRIAAIVATRRGDVAYASDGSRIVSKADAAGKSSRA
jgi:hypothetical protein